MRNWWNSMNLPYVSTFLPCLPVHPKRRPFVTIRLIGSFRKVSSVLQLGDYIPGHTLTHSHNIVRSTKPDGHRATSLHSLLTKKNGNHGSSLGFHRTAPEQTTSHPLYISADPKWDPRQRMLSLLPWLGNKRRTHELTVFLIGFAPIAIYLCRHTKGALPMAHCLLYHCADAAEIFRWLPQ